MKSFKDYTQSLKKNGTVKESFLDDDNEEQLTADKLAATKEETTPFPDKDTTDDALAAGTTDDLNDNELDLSDEKGTIEAEQDKTEKEDLADLKLDELNDDKDVTDSGDEKKEQQEEEKKEAEATVDALTKLQDTIVTLTSKFDTLIDKLDNGSDQQNTDNTTDSIDDLGLDNLPSDSGNAGGDSAPANSDTTGADNIGGEGEPAPEQSGEGGEQTSEGGEGGEQTSEEDKGGSDEDFGEDETDSTKSEAYNYCMKKGHILNSKSGSIVGMIAHKKQYELDEMFKNIIRSKFRQLVEKRKAELKENHFNI